MRFFLIILLSGLFLFGIASCNNKINEPEIPEKYNYELSKTEAKFQTEILLNETLTVLLETIKKRIVTTKTEFELIKKYSTNNNYYSNGWYVWQDKVTDNPFGKNNAFNASYISKILFNNNDPAKADTTKSNFTVHTKYGFLSNSIYGDEVNFSINSLLLKPTSENNSISIKTNAEYKRHWIGNYDGVNSDLQYNVFISGKNLRFKSSGSKEWFEGIIIIDYYNFKFNAVINKNNIASILFYRNGSLIESYNIELTSLKINQSLSKSNREVFPGYSSVNEKFVNLLVNFPDAGSEDITDISNL